MTRPDPRRAKLSCYVELPTKAAQADQLTRLFISAVPPGIAKLGFCVELPTKAGQADQLTCLFIWAELPGIKQNKKEEKYKSQKNKKIL